MMLSFVLLYLVPGAQFALTGNPTTEKEYDDSLEWLDERPKPTWAQVQAAIPEYEANKANAVVKSDRLQAYRDEADPLFFGWQRGENTEQAWLDKVAEIRARFPYAE